MMDRRLLDMARARVLVVGDLILDRYWHGATRRISPEAPVPIVVVDTHEDRVGGAANVAANAAALGARTVLIGVLGQDRDGDVLLALCAELGITAEAVRLARHATTVKLRVVSQRQQLVRLDFEPAVAADVSAGVLDLLTAHLPGCDVVVVSDYGKGAVASAADVIAAARTAGKAVVVDPKGTDFTRYAGATLLTPNLQEFEAVAGRAVDDADLARRALAMCRELRLGGVLVTRGAAGMSLIRPDAAPVHLAARAREVFDVTGAGDTVCAVTAAALAAGADLVTAITLANAAAGIVVGKFGAATVSRAEIDAALAHAAAIRRGVVDTDVLLEERANARRRGEVVVMTNGCFDLLHEGHVRYLAAARALGDRLVVAVNDDASVTALKGPGRPVNPLASRMRVLAALADVDWVVPFAAPTPRVLVGAVLPDVLVKGGDYAVDDIAGAEEVLAAGGRVTTVEYHAGFSTTGLLAALRRDGGDAA
jgi:D-beta-D-heptose 7-phosphate kinase/D-beta-D-heptose 1-phosphate adenosyltransferase